MAMSWSSVADWYEQLYADVAAAARDSSPTDVRAHHAVLPTGIARDGIHDTDPDLDAR